MTWEADAKRFLLWQATGTRWSVHAIRLRFEHEIPQAWRVLRDADDRPFIVAWRNDAPYWIAVFRPR